MNEDMSQFLGVFLDEASEHLECLEQDFLRLEQEASPELIQSIFRAAHTLKGSARQMGYAAMGELTHAMEDVFDRLRHEELALSPNLIDALFVSLDALKAMRDEIAASGNVTLDTTVGTARLREVLNGGAPDKSEAGAGQSAPSVTPNATDAKTATGPATTEAGAPPALISSLQIALTATELMAAHEARSAGCDIVSLRVSVAPDCVMKSVRALMVLQALEQVGSVLTTMPSEEGLENEEFETDFEVVLATEQTTAAVCQTIRRITEITDVQARAWDESALISNPPPAAPPASDAPTGNVAPVLTLTAPDETPSKTLAAEAKTEAKSEPEDERVVAAGPQGRGKSDAEVQRLARDRKGAQAQTVRVDVARLDKLLNLVGELVIDRTRIAQIGGRFERQERSSELVESLNEAAAHIGRITDELQEEIMKARMLPIDNVFSRFPRMIRDLAQKLGKEIEFLVEGKETELDRSVIEIIGDPLIHMLRNSVDHGVEMPDARLSAGKPRVGTVWLRARYEDNHIVIEIQDDGAGMDPEKLRAHAVRKGVLTPEAAARLTDKEAVHLIFAPGFSTAQSVSDVSGRGVGMDIVKSNLQKLGALIDIESRAGVGSTFTVKLPLTLAIIRGLLVTVSGCVYALPLASVVETLKIAPEALHRVNRREVILQRGRTLPIVRLSDVFHLDAAAVVQDSGAVVPQAGRSAEDGIAPSLLTPPAAPLIAERVKAEIKTETLAKDAAPPVLTLTAGEETAVVRRTERNGLYLVVIGMGEKQVGLVVDSLIGEQEVVIKSLGKFIGDIKGISGATILGDGRVALIVDINGLINLAVEEKGKAHAA